MNRRRDGHVLAYERWMALPQWPCRAAIPEVSVSESNFMGRGQFVRLAVSEGQFSRGVGWACNSAVCTWAKAAAINAKVAAGPYTA